MTRFIGVNVKHQQILEIVAISLVTAQASLGLTKVDHGVLKRESDGSGLGYVVDEFGWYKPADDQFYAIVLGRAIAGNAVIYAFDYAGKTIDAEPNLLDFVRGHMSWLPTRADLERAIALSAVARPEISINGQVVWRWPGPAPAGIMR